VGLSRALVAAQQHGEAAMHARRAVEVAPDRSNAHEALGSALMAKEDFGSALSAFQTAIAANPTDANAHYGLAMAYERLGNSSAAQRAWCAYLRVDSTSDRAWRVAENLVPTGEELLYEGSSFAWSPDGKRIVFHRWFEGQKQIVIGAVDGSGEPVEVARIDAPLGYIDWSPDGRFVAFEQRERVSANAYKTARVWIKELWIDDPPRLLDPEARAQYPRWSGDGTRMLFTLVTINRVGVAGFEAGKLTGPIEATSVWWYGPDWLPDGRRIVSAGWGATGNSIYVGGLDGRGTRVLPGRSKIGYHNLSCCPDGRKIVFISNLQAGKWGACAMSLSSRHEPRFLFPSPSQWSVARWSPDARKMILLPRLYTFAGLHAHLFDVKLLGPPAQGAVATGRRATLTFEVRGVAEKEVTCRLRYELFDSRSIRLSQGPMAPEDVQLTSGDATRVSAELPVLDPGEYALKVVGSSAKGTAQTELLDLRAK